MCDADREECLAELKKHEDEISMLSLELSDVDRDVADRHVAYLNAQVIRHRISVALLKSRLGLAA